MDLSSMSISELRDLQQQIPLELKRREAQDKINILNEEIQKVIDIYKNRYPELFRSID